VAFRGIVWECGQILLTDVDPDGFPIAQPDGVGGDPRVEPYEMIHPFGFYGRPRDPDTDAKGNPIQGKGCTALIGVQGHDKYLLPLADPRGIDQFPKAGSVQYFPRADGKKSYVWIDPDGNLTVLVEYNGGEHKIEAAINADHVKVDGAKITSDGNVITANGVDLDNHVHPTAMGPSEKPTPTPPI
jgi:hypothetical protein